MEPRLAQVVEMRYFGGMTEVEIGETLGLTERTVRRDWEKARLLLASMLEVGRAVALADGVGGAVLALITAPGTYDGPDQLAGCWITMWLRTCGPTTHPALPLPAASAGSRTP